MTAASVNGQRVLRAWLYRHAIRAPRHATTEGTAHHALVERYLANLPSDAPTDRGLS